MGVKSNVKSSDIARIAGVSRATVSYVLNNRSDQAISEETRQRVHSAVKETGYRPNSTARALATGKVDRVALWVPVPNRSVYGHVIEQTMRNTMADGYHIVIVQAAEETPESLSAAHLLDSMSFDGILALDATAIVESVMAKFTSLPSIVSMGPAYSWRTDHVGVDLKGGSLLAMRHLVEQGCRKIAFIAHRTHQSAGDPRYDAYMEVIKETDRQPEIIVVEDPARKDARAAVYGRYISGDRPDGLFCFNDDCAFGALKALADLGISVPEDVAVIGSDGIDEAQYVTPSISTVAQPFEQMCRLAWEFLVRRMKDPTLPMQRAILPMTLEARASSSRLATRKSI